MHPEHRSRLSHWLWLLAVAVAVAGIWWALEQLEPRADWVKVEGSRQAVVGQQLILRVHVAPLAEPAYLCAHLHWRKTHDRTEGALASGGAKAVGKEGGTFDFTIIVPPRNGLRFVTGVIFLSRTGSWHDHTRVAGTELIPVSGQVGGVETRLERLRLQPSDERSKQPGRPAALPRVVIGVVFLVAAVAAWRAGQTLADFGAEQERRWWKGLAIILLLACLWELLGVENWLGSQARAMARAEDVYYSRGLFQKPMSSAAIAATAMFLVKVSRRARMSRRLLYSALGLYVGISALSLLSLHAIDKVALASWHGLAVIQALKLGCALLILQGVRSERNATKVAR
jgi:hypothetical protein